MKRQMIALLLALLLSLSLAACGSGAAEVSESPAPAEATPAATDDAPSTIAIVDTAETKYDRALAAFEPDAVVMTVNGQDVRWDEYFYCIAAIGRIYDQTAPFDSWSEELGSGYTYQSYAMEYAEDMLSQYWTVEQQAAANGVTLDEAALAEIEAMRAEDMNGFSGEEEFNAYLRSMYLTPAFYQRVLEDSELYVALFDTLFGEAGEKLSDADAMAYLENAGYLRAKHILFYILDEEGEEISAEEKAEVLAHAEEILGVLTAIDDPEERIERFESLMYAWSEDTGLYNYPDGYCFAPGTMVPAFEDAAAALGEYEITGELVESRFGYHIILRLPIDLDETKDMDGYPMRYVAADGIFSALTDDWFSGAEIEYTPEFAELDFDSIFE